MPAFLGNQPNTLENKKHWTLEIYPKAGLFDLKIKEFWQYRDLIFLFVKRELVPTYKQTVLGPLWFILQPLLTTFVYSLIFSVVARIPTDDLPQILFYLPGIVLWNFFNTSFLKSSNTFIANTHIFGKVYFPRLILPISGLLASLVNFGIQFCLFMTIYGGYMVYGVAARPSIHVLIFPVLLLIVSLFSTGLGMIVASFTTRYRDLNHFLAFGTQLLMYATPIIYPASIVPQSFRWVTEMNPLSAVFEAFRFAFLGKGQFLPNDLMISLALGIAIFCLGLILFTKAERTSIDTV